MESSNNRNPNNTPFPVPTNGLLTRLFKHSAIYSISTSMQRLQGLILIPIYTSTVYIPAVSQYGDYGLVYTFIAFMNFVYLYGMDSAFLRYYFLGKTDRKTVFSSTFFVLVLTGLLTSLLIYALSENIARWILFSVDLADLIKLAAVILFLDTVGNLPFLILRAEEKAGVFTVFRIMRFVLELLFNLVFVVILKWGVPGILYANILAAFINLLFMLPFSVKYLVLKIDRKLLWEMIGFGLPFLPNGIAFMTIEMIDRFLVTNYLGKNTLAAYHANYKFATVLLLFIVGFRNAWQPFFLKISKQKTAPAVYKQVLEYYIFGAGMVVILFSLFIKNILTYQFFGRFYLLNNQEYWVGIDFIPWIILAYYLFGIYILFTPAFYIQKKSQYMMLFTGTGALINIICNLLLLPRIGIWGAVIATVMAYLVMAFSIVVTAQRIYPIPIESRKLIGSLISILIILSIYSFLAMPFVMKILVVIVYNYLSWLFVLSREAKSAIIKKISLLFRH
jgi:O-antigen/teichoic acid export membrane protein